MSCDIYIFAEVQNNGRWEMVGRDFPNTHYRTDEAVSERNQPRTNQPYQERNYRLFAMLANVRNGHGFAGVPTGQGFNPVAYPRGVPADASPEYRECVTGAKQAGLLCHSHSWLTLRELLNYNWAGQTTVLYDRPCLEEDYARYLATGEEPTGRRVADFWGVEVLTPEEYEDMLASGSRDASRRYAIAEPRRMTYLECAREFVEGTLPELEKLGDPEDVRIVFFFDN